MDDLANYFSAFLGHNKVLGLRESRGSFDTMLILIGVALSSRTSVATQIVIRMPPDGVL